MKDTRVTKLNSFLYKFDNKFNTLNEAPIVHDLLLLFYKLNYETLLMPVNHEVIHTNHLMA